MPKTVVKGRPMAPAFERPARAGSFLTHTLDAEHSLWRRFDPRRVMSCRPFPRRYRMVGAMGPGVGTIVRNGQPGIKRVLQLFI